ncbi:MAG: hypothetical protein AAFQ94_02910 [Bacteroidota bacterium]
MKKLLLLIFALVTVYQSSALHIVGGEFQLVHLEGSNYRLNFFMYFDRVQTVNPDPETSINVSIFENDSESLIETLVLSLTDLIDLEPGRDDCRIDLLSINKVIYSVDVQLSPELYNHPDGYHIVWERCCRNEGIVNIVNPLGTGATFVMNFPALVNGGEPVSNTSPALNTPSLDYACVGQLYESDFTATDADGDSLVYNLQIPLNSSASVPVSTPSPKSMHMPVDLADGLDLSNIVPGMLNLQIDAKGKIALIPSDPGLYVYAVEVKEYRDNELIGSVLRDYQLLVLDDCVPSADISSTAVRASGSTTFSNDVTSISLDNAVDNCLDFLLVTEVNTNFSETSLDVLAVDFSEGTFFDAAAAGISIDPEQLSDDSILYKVCLPACSFTPSNNYTLDLVGKTDNCSLADADTVRVTVNLPFSVADQGTFADETRDVAVNIRLDETYQEVFRVLNYDEENLSVALVDLNGKVNDFSNAGLTINTFSADGSELEVTINWEPSCEGAPSIIGDDVEIALALYNEVFCNSLVDMIRFDLSLAGLNNPYIEDFNPDLLVLETEPGQTVTKEFDFQDDDGEILDITLRIIEPANTTFSQLGINFTSPDAPVGSAKAVLEWTPNCDEIDFDQAPEVKLELSANDLDICESPAITYEITGEVTSVDGSRCVITSVETDRAVDFAIKTVRKNEVSFFHLATQLQVSVYDLTGRLVYQKDHDVTGDLYTVSTSLNTGQLYVLKAGNETIKFIGK